MKKMEIKKGDLVEIICGGIEAKGKRGKVLAASPKNGTVVVEGLNMVKRHTRARSAQQPGGIIEKPRAIDVSNVMIKEPDSAQNRAPSLLTKFSSGKIGRFFMPRPIADASKCRGCGECVASCPQHTIVLDQKNGKKIARIRHADCIRCYCCQELCPFEAIRIKKNFIIRLIDAL